MTSLEGIDLGKIFRKAVQTAVNESVRKTRPNSVLMGTVEDINPEELDVVWVRMDDEARGNDLTQSMNYEEPGVIPVTRLGETFEGEQVRVSYDGSSGASANRTSVESHIVLPYGVEVGQRIDLNGENGTIRLFDEFDSLVGQLDPFRWEIGGIDPIGARLVLDPTAGIRIHDAGNNVVVIFDSNGYSLRDSVTGQVLAEIAHGQLRLVDPATSDHIELTTDATASLPNPNVRFDKEASPSSSFVAPACTTFTIPADDLEISHAVSWIAGVNQSGSMTPPSGETEQVDTAVANAIGSLNAATSTRDPATGAVGTYTSTLSNWHHATMVRAVVRGGGTTSPAFRSSATNSVVTSAMQTNSSVPTPTGVVDGDALIAFVSVAAKAGLVPLSWETPHDVNFLGATFSTSGSGASQSTLATGAWVKRAKTGEPSSFDVDIQLPTGDKIIHATTIAVSDPFLIPGGSQIRIAGHPIRRQLAFNELTSPSATLCDLQNISQAYDNLQLVIDGRVDLNGGSTARRHRIRFNGDTAGNYFDRIWSSSGTNVQGFGVTFLRGSVISAVNGNATTGVWDILGYSRPGSQRVVQGRHMYVDNLLIHTEAMSGIWGSTSGINRIVVDVDGTPQRYAAGSRVYLYGW